MNRLSALAAAAAVGLGVGACHKSASSYEALGTRQAAAKYHCPMHPEYIANRPGDCPICNMSLVVIKAQEPGTASRAESGSEGGQVANQGTVVTGRVPVMLSPDSQQRIGLRTATVEPRQLVTTIRATASVQPDETRLAKIVMRSSGWVLGVKVNFVGQAVTNGQPLLTVYSPELLAIENDYALAYTAYRKSLDGDMPKASAMTNYATMMGHGMPDQRDAFKTRMEAAHRRLEFWQIGEQEMRVLEQGNRPTEELLLRSPVSGYITVREAFIGTTFQPGTTLYEVADLSRVWLRAFVSEHDLAQIHIGQKARITFPSLDNKVRESSVAFIAPRIDPQTRRAEVRLELDNSTQELRSDMWADVDIEASMGKVLAVPASAVLDTGRRTLAFVQRSDGSLVPSEVRIGLRTGDYWQVLSGLKEGDSVVTRALFLVDAESQLRAAIAGMDSKVEHADHLSTSSGGGENPHEQLTAE